MFKKILVGVDGSDNSRRAAAQAADLAELFHSSVTLLSVVRPMEYTLAVESGAFIEGMSQFFHGVIDNYLDEVYRPGLEINGKVEVGKPWKVLVDFAKAGSYDLIVIGAHGAGKLSEEVLGSTSTHVVHHASVPVIVVP